MIWFDKLSAVLSAYYGKPQADPIVGYLKGSGRQVDWINMIKNGRRAQMIILGSAMPTAAEWTAAGVAQRAGDVQTVTLSQLAGWGLMIGYAGAVLRPWGEIIQFTAEFEANYEQNTLQRFRANMPKPPAAKNAPVVSAAVALLSSIESKTRELSIDHKSQMDLITGKAGDVTGFFGYWTNHLFNTDIPPLGIWNEVWAQTLHARSLLREGKLGEAGRTIIAARDAYMKASGIYIRWKNGIDGAGVKMQVAIGAVALTLILAAVAATVATAATAGAAATGTATTTVEGVASLVTRGDGLLVRVVLSDSAPQAATSALEYERALNELGEGVQQLMRMCE